MTEQQPQSPIDDLFRNSFESLPNTPAESGWDTPSDRVWQHVQANIQSPRKGWSTQSLVLIAAFAVSLAIGIYWMLTNPAEKPATTPTVTPVEQPVAAPQKSDDFIENQPVTTPKSSTGNTPKDSQTKVPPRNSTEEHGAKTGNNTAQPLPGSKQTLPPNTTEAQKKKPSGN